MSNLTDFVSELSVTDSNVFEKEEEVWPEERLKELFRILEPLFLPYIKATHLLPNLPFLRPFASKITKTERKSLQDSTKLLLELVSESDELNKWNTFATALKESEFLSLYKICHVCKESEFKFFSEIFDLLSVDFAENGVDIINLSIGMLNLNSLSKKEFQQIKLVFRQEGESAAILEFLSCLPTSLETWLKNILPCLYGVNKIELCKLIKRKGSEISIYPNEDLENLVQFHHNLIINRVRPQDIRSILRAYDLMTDMNIKSLSPMEEMEEILSNIQRSSVAGKWRSFVQALSEAGYTSLYTKLTNYGDIIDDSIELAHIKLMAPVVVKRIDVSFELLLQVKNELINVRCSQEINRRKNEYGNIAAAEMLLDNIYRFKDGWYNSFLMILVKVGQQNVAEKIEPDFECILKMKNLSAYESKMKDYMPS